MNSFTRILQYMWPHRGKIFLSAVFATFVAVLWSLNLSAAFPVVKVLMEQQSLGEYVEQELTEAEAETEKRTAQIAQYDRLLAELPETATPGSEEVELLRSRSRQQERLSSATRKSLLMNWLKRNVIPWLPGDQFDMLALILVMLLAATILKSICVFIQEILVGSVVQLTVMDIRKECFRRTLKLDYQTLANNGTSDLMSRFTYDMNVLVHGLALLGGKVVREPLKALGCVTFAFYVNWRLTLLSILFVPVVGYAFYRIGSKLKIASKKMMESMSRLYKTLEETFVSLKVVIAFNGGHKHRSRFHRENKEYYGKAMKLVRLDALTSPTMEILGLFAVFIALLPGAYLVLRGTKSIWGITLASAPMDMAELSLLYVLLAGTLDPARKLSTTYAKLKRATAAADRVFALIDMESLVTESTEPVRSLPLSREIQFKDIRFTYAQAKDGMARPMVLDGVSLRVRAGEVIVVVGENGSGKSTLVNLLPRFYDPEQGAVLIDNIDVRDLRLRDLREQISVVTQETLLFDESIFENIRYGRTNAKNEEIQAAAEQAHVMSFVDELPDGLQTRVGEKGQKLSGGQRQRIALARAILRNPQILILDEATSAIDAHSERLIHETLREFAHSRTVFLITHSVSQSILDFVDRIAVMDRGRLIAVGPHEQLMTSCPVYSKLYRAQVDQRAGGDEQPDPPPFHRPDGPPGKPSPHLTDNQTAAGHTQPTPAGASSELSTDSDPDILPLRRPPAADRTGADRSAPDLNKPSKKPTGSDG